MEIQKRACKRESKTRMSNIRLIGVLDNENKSEEIFEEITCELL